MIEQDCADRRECLQVDFVRMIFAVPGKDYRSALSALEVRDCRDILDSTFIGLLRQWARIAVSDVIFDCPLVTINLNACQFCVTAFTASNRISAGWETRGLRIQAGIMLPI